MKRAMTFAVSFLVSIFSLAGCLGGEAGMPDDEEPGEVPQSLIPRPVTTVVTPSPPSDFLCVTPPAANQADALRSNSSDGEFVDSSNPGGYVVEITNLGGWFRETASAQSAEADQSESICEHTATTATFFGWYDLYGCWLQIGLPQSKLGVYNLGNELAPAFCDDGVSWSIPPSVSKVRIKGQSVRQTASGLVGQTIREGVLGENL